METIVMKSKALQFCLNFNVTESKLYYSSFSVIYCCWVLKKSLGYVPLTMKLSLLHSSLHVIFLHSTSHLLWISPKTLGVMSSLALAHLYSLHRISLFHSFPHHVHVQTVTPACISFEESSVQQALKRLLRRIWVSDIYYLVLSVLTCSLQPV